jgi:hypothetical protein
MSLDLIDEPLAAGGSVDQNIAAMLDRLDRMTQRGSGLYGTQVGVLQPAANTSGTLTLSAPGAGLRHYLTSVYLTRAATAALAGAATLAITTTNLGATAWRTGNAMAAGGLVVDVNQVWPFGFASAAAAQATTIVLPAPGLAVLWSLLVTYFVAS